MNFDADGNLRATSMNDGSDILSTNSFEFDENGNRVASVTWRSLGEEWEGATNSSVLDAQGRVVQNIDPLGFTNIVAYNAIGKQEYSVDKLQRTNRFEYDWQGRLWRTTYADQNTDTFYFDANGNRTNSVDRGERPTSYAVDALGRVTHIVYADNATNRTVFDDLGRVRFSVDAKGVTNAFGYVQAGRRTSVTNAWGTSEQQVHRYGFDENGNQVWAMDPNGVGVTNVFDALNRLVEVKFADGTRKLTGFNAGGRRVAETNQDNIVTLFGFDGLGRLTSVTNAFGTTNQIITRYAFDEAGNQTTQIDALLRTNRYDYNLLGQRVAHWLPDGTNVERFAFDAVGNLIRHTNFNGVVITNEFDVMNRLTNVISINAYNVSFTYTPTGQRLTMTDASGTTTYEHDPRGRLVLKTVAWIGGPEISLNYAHDANGNVTNIWSSSPSGVNLRYEHDALNRITNVLAGGSQAASYSFDLNGNLQSVHYGNGVTHLCQYDLLNQLTNSVWKSNQLALASFYYQLGKTGNRTNLTETLFTSVTNRTYSWTYDALYRLTSESISGLGGASYGLDKVGNRTNRSAGLDYLPAQNFSYGANDWLTTDAYDSNGNTLWSTNGAAAAGPYYYNVENRLTNFNNTVFLTCNGDGSRVKKTVGDTSSYFLIDDRNPTGYAQVLEEWTISGGTTNLSRVYNFGLALISQHETSGPTYYFISDGHGSTRMLVNDGGVAVNALTYDAFGNLIAPNGPPQTPHLYCGEQWDKDLGVYYLRARYYKPEIGRFWTMDTFEGNRQDPLSLHKYLYCHADPVNGIDPSGLMTLTAQLPTFGTYSSLASISLSTISKVTAGLLADRLTRDQLFLFHVTDETFVKIAKKYNSGAFRASGSTHPMFFATTSTHVASLIMYGVGYPAMIYGGGFEKATIAGIKAFASDLGIPYSSLSAELQKPSNKPVVVLTGKKGSMTGRLFFNGGISVEGWLYVPAIYSTFTTAPGELVRAENYKLFPSVQ